jgi:glucokinase
MLLAGDIGGTKTLLGLFDALPVRPRPLATQSFPTLDYDDLGAMLLEFLAAEHVGADAIDAACFGVAGPVLDDTAELTNVPWKVDAHRVANALGIRRLRLLNDLQAMPTRCRCFRPTNCMRCRKAKRWRGGNIALIAAGTGLGEALLHHVDGRFVPSPSEGGHADFPPGLSARSNLLRDLTARYGRADVEHVVSGTRLDQRAPHDASPTMRRGDRSGRCGCAGTDHRRGIGRHVQSCADTLELFVSAYGAEAGNLALRTVATGASSSAVASPRKSCPR